MHLEVLSIRVIRGEHAPVGCMCLLVAAIPARWIAFALESFVAVIICKVQGAVWKPVLLLQLTQAANSTMITNSAVLQTAMKCATPFLVLSLVSV